MEKISSFAKYAVGLALAFCKCADVGWKRINFEMKGCVFTRNFLIALHITEKVFAKDGIKMTKLSIVTNH